MRGYGNDYSKRLQKKKGACKEQTLPPALDVNPTVGFIPARLLLLVGQVMLPSVSDPRVTAARPIEAATPEPEEEPHGSAFTK